MEKSVILFSAGQDSTTCVAWGISQQFDLYPISFFYGQRHSIEIQRGDEVLKVIDDRFHTKLRERRIIIDISFLPNLVTSALTEFTNKDDINSRHPEHPNLPASFVPNRNALFITIAHAYAQKLGADFLIGGMCETDYSGYPDCRREFIEKIISSLNLGSEVNIFMHTPLMSKTKEQTFKMACDLKILDIIINNTHTCYEGVSKINEWGHGCGECPACLLRKKGWEEFKINSLVEGL